MQQVAASDDEQSRKVAELAATAISLSDETSHLSDLVRTFKLGDS